MIDDDDDDDDGDDVMFGRHVRSANLSQIAEGEVAFRSSRRWVCETGNVIGHEIVFEWAML